MDHDESRRVIYRGRKIDLALQTVTLVNGSRAEREVVLHRGAVALLPMLPGDRLCLVKNERYSIGGMLLEVPAGTMDAGESPDVTAVRELREETGYVAGSISKIGEWWVSPGLFTERMHLYLCQNLTPGPTDLQEDEALESVIVSWDEAIAMVADGRIDDAKTMLAIIIGQKFRRVD